MKSKSTAGSRGTTSKAKPDTSKGRAAKRWILSVTPSMWHTVRRRQAYATGAKAETIRIRMHDRLIFYALGTGKFVGICEVQSQWTDPTGRWPARVTDEARISRIIEGTASVRGLAPSLQFVRKSRWVGLHLHAGIGNYGRPITARDYDVISGGMRGGQSTLQV